MDEFTKPGEVGYTVTAYMDLQAENAELRSELKDALDELKAIGYTPDVLNRGYKALTRAERGK